MTGISVDSPSLVGPPVSASQSCLQFFSIGVCFLAVLLELHKHSALQTCTDIQKWSAVQLQKKQTKKHTHKNTKQSSAVYTKLPQTFESCCLISGECDEF